MEGPVDEDCKLVTLMLRTLGSGLGATETRFASSRSVRSSLLQSRVTSSQDSPEETLDSDGSSSTGCAGLAGPLPVRRSDLMATELNGTTGPVRSAQVMRTHRSARIVLMCQLSNSLGSKTTSQHGSSLEID